MQSGNAIIISNSDIFFGHSRTSQLPTIYPPNFEFKAPAINQVFSRTLGSIHNCSSGILFSRIAPKGRDVFYRSQFVIPPICGIMHRPTLPTHRFFQKFTDEQFEKIPQNLEQESHEDEKAKICCKFCGHQITSFDKKIEVNGRHRHIFSNPSEFLFEIGCFSAANGCVNQGHSTIEYTWFNGFAWRFALCSNCLVHLGWFYQSENDGFYGLILNHLEEAH